MVDLNLTRVVQPHRVEIIGLMATRGASWTTQRSKPRTAGPDSKGDLRFERLGAFYTSLSEKLDALQQEVQPKWLTLEWVTTAVDFMRSTFADMVILFEDVCTQVKAADELWIEEYMVESMKLLDVCNVIKPALSRFEHSMMCVQLVVQAMQRCAAGSKRYASDKALTAALQCCECELNQLVHLPLTMMGSSRTASQPETRRLAPKPSTTDSPQRYATIAIGEKFTADGINASVPYLGPSQLNDSSVWSVKASRISTVELTLVMRATRETTDFVASVLIWALERDPSSHLASTALQRNLEVLHGDDILWSPSFRRLQERLRKVLSEVFRDEPSVRPQFALEELKLVEECTSDLRVEIEELASREKLGEEPSMHLLGNLEQRLVELLGMIQVNFLISNGLMLWDAVLTSSDFHQGRISHENLTQQIRLEKVSSQVNQLFDELVQARKKLLDVAQGPGKIHRAHTF